MINLIDMILIVDNVISDDESELLISEFETKKPFKEQSMEINSSEVWETNADFIDLIPKTKVQQIVNDKTNIMVGHYKDYIEKLDHFDTHGLISNLEYAHRYRIIRYNIGQSFHDHIDKNPFIFGRMHESKIHHSSVVSSFFFHIKALLYSFLCSILVLLQRMIVM